jgi:hypothetical protein
MAMELITELLIDVMSGLIAVCLGWAVYQIYECVQFSRRGKEEDE